MAATANIDIVLSSGAKAGQTLKELQQTANRLNREIKDLKPGSEAWVKKTKDFQQVTGRLGNLRKEIKGVNKDQSGLLQSFAQMLPFGGQIQALKGQFGGLRQGVGGVTKGFHTLRGAIMATGIGALLIAIGSLVAMFKSSEEGQDKWNKIMKVSGVIIGNLSDILANLGETIYDAVVNPVAAAKKAWEGLKKFFSDPLGTIKEGYDAAKEAAKEFIEETEKEVKQAQTVADLEAQTNRLERKLLVERKQIEAEIAELRLKARQEDQFSSEERLQFLNEANSLQENLLDKDTEIARNRYEIIRQTNQFSKSTKENLDAEAAAQARLSEVEVTRFNQARQIERERQRIRKEIDRDEKAAIAARAKAEADLQKELDADEKERQETIKADLAEIATLRQQNHENQIENLEINAEAEKLALDDLLVNKLISQEDYNRAVIELELERLQEELLLKQKYYGEESAEAKKVSNEIKAIKTDESNYLNSLEEQKKAQRMAAAQGTLSFLTTISGGIASLHDEESEKGKRAAITAARIQTIQAALSAYASTVQIPIVGTVLAPIAAAAALIFGNIKVNQMQNVRPKASMGMVLRGPSHASGGIPVEAEGDEIILTKGVYRDPVGRQMASDLNAAYGGIRFMEAGGPVNPLGIQQTASSVSGISGGATLQATESMTAAFEGFKQEISEWQRNLQVNNNVQDTRKGINVINNLESDAGF